MIKEGDLIFFKGGADSPGVMFIIKVCDVSNEFTYMYEGKIDTGYLNSMNLSVREETYHEIVQRADSFMGARDDRQR